MRRGLAQQQADGTPQYIALLEDAQKKAKRAQMPIADAEIVMMVSAAVLAVQHFPREVENWEGLPAVLRTWTAWKTAFRLAHLKRQRQILASKRGEPLGGAHVAIPVSRAMEAALDKLALAATSDKLTVQQLTAANLDLTTTVATLTATNKKLVDAASKKQKWTAAPGAPVGAPAGALSTPGNGWGNKAYPGNYCWTHGPRCRKDHTSATCTNKAERHKNDTTAAYTKGVCTDNKGWEKA